MAEFSKVIGVFGPLLIIQIQEAPLNYGRKDVPHGNLGILVVSPIQNTQTGVLIIDGVADQVLLTVSMKIEESLDSPGSGEMCVVVTCSVAYSLAQLLYSLPNNKNI